MYRPEMHQKFPNMNVVSQRHLRNQEIAHIDCKTVFLTTKVDYANVTPRNASKVSENERRFWRHLRNQEIARIDGKTVSFSTKVEYANVSPRNASKVSENERRF